MMNITALTPLEPQEFAAFGVNLVAYLKPVQVNGENVFAIHAADGTRLTLINGERAVAIAAIRQNDLEAASVH